MTERLGNLALGPIAGGEGDPLAALKQATRWSDYISRIERRRPEIFEKLRDGPEAVLTSALAEIDAAGAVAGKLDEPMRAMRLAKEAAHAAIAAGDLSGRWTLDDVVERLTQLAD